MKMWEKENQANPIMSAAQAVLSHCDGAVTLDGVGYNKMDAYFVRDVLDKPHQSFRQLKALHKILRKYRAQLTELGIDYDSIPQPQEETNNVSRKKSSNGSIPLDYVHFKFVLHSPYSFKDQAKAIPTAKWVSEDKAWRYLNRPEVAAAFQPYIESGVVKPSAAALEALKTSRTAQLQQNKAAAIKGIKDPKVKLSIRGQTPYSHQKKAFSIAITLDQAALIMEQGTGKTLPAIAAIGYRHKTDNVHKVLVICPSTVSTVWEAELEKIANFDYELLNLVDLKTEKRAKLLRESKHSLQIAVINYESSWREIDLLLKWGPDMVILDESQKVKHGRKKQSKGVHKLGDTVRFKLILTGTPVTQGPLDIWSQYRFLNPNIFGRKFISFRERYAIMGGFEGHKVLGYRNLDELTERVYSIAYRVTRAEALDLPPTIDQDLKITLSKEAQKLYEKMEQDFVIGFANGEFATAPIILTQLLRLQQITGGFITTEKGTSVKIDSAKLTAVRELLEDLPNDKKVVIFARFIPEVTALMEVTKELGIKAVKLTGEVDNRERGNIIKQFQTDSSIRVFIAQIQTGGLGITLTAGSVGIFYSTTFSFSDYEQAKARMHRIGQHNPVTYIHLVTGGTIDEEIIQALRDKEEMAEKVLAQRLVRRAMISLEKNKPEEGWFWDETDGSVIRWADRKEGDIETLGKAKNQEEAKRLVEKFNKGGIKSMAVSKKKLVKKTKLVAEEEEGLESKELEELAEEEGKETTTTKEGTKKMTKETKKTTKEEPKKKTRAERRAEAKAAKEPKATKESKEKAPAKTSNMLIVADLAKEFKKEEKVIRRALRELFTDHEPRTPWEFKPGSKDHQKIQKEFAKK